MRIPHLLALSAALIASAFARGEQLADLPKIKLERLFVLEKPVEVGTDPMGRLYMIEQVGRVRFVEDGKPTETPYLDLTKKVFVDYECGLLGIAFHPKFKENGYVYANYTAKAPKLHTFISEFKVDPEGKRIDPATERVVMKIEQPYVNHNGGQIAFGPRDGMLYIGMGDGGSAHDPQNRAQDPTSLLGKMLRIDVSIRDGYASPHDNPFVHKQGWRPEIWALGLRNPWRFTFDPPTGLLYAADVGQDEWEEVDIIERGGNYGWRIREGKHDLHPPKDGKRPEMTDPIFEYATPKLPGSITGGVVYRGDKIPALKGWYVFADYSLGTIYGLVYEDGKVTWSGVLVQPTDPKRSGGARPTQPSSFGVGPDGTLYMTDANGPVYRIVAGE
jgi:glucose/arabinose dehydrogenase